MNCKFLQTAKHLLAVSVLLGFTMMAHATTFVTSYWKKGLENASMRGAYVCANKGGDGDLKNAFDGKFGNGEKIKYGSSSTFPLVLDLIFPTPQVFTTYDLHTLDWLQGVQQRSPKEWKLEGSNDFKNWTELDYHDNGADYFTEVWQKVEFPFENSTAYKCYRLTFLSCISGSYFGLMEIDFPQYVATVPMFVDLKLDMTMNTASRVGYLDTELIRTSENSIKINSSVYSDNTLTEIGVVYSSTETLPTLSTGQKVIGYTTNLSLFSAEIAGLTANTTYYVRPFAVNAQGTGYGDVFAVTTASGDASLLKSVAPIFDNREVRMSVTVGELAGGITERGVVLSEQPAPTVESAQKYVDKEAIVGLFNATIGNLQPRTCYHARPYVIQNGVTSYGAESTFYTLPVAQSNWKEGAVITTSLTSDISWWGNLIGNAFDKNTNTRFTGMSQTYLLFSFEKGNKLQQYTIGNSDSENRYPISWEIKASNDNVTWTTLHAVMDHVWSGKYTSASFSFENDNYYNYYMLDVTKNGSHSCTDIAEFDFPQYPNPDTGTSIDVDADEERAVRSFVDSNNRVVVLNTSEEPVRAELYNAIGQKVYSQELSARINVIGAAVKSGVYVLQLNSPAVGTVVNKLIIK